MIRSIAVLSILASSALALAQNQPPANGDPPPDVKPPPGGGGDTAKPATSEEEQRERAKPFYINARRQHEDKEYLAAAENYLAAYREYPKPAFIYNAAQVYRLGGNLEKALEHYKKYVDLEPDGEGARYAREFIASIEKKLAEPKPDPAPDPDDTSPPDPGDPDKGADTGDTQKHTVGDASGDIRPEPIPVIPRSVVNAEGLGKRLAGLGLASVGVVLVGVGVGYGFHARSLDKEASEFMGSFDDLEDIYDRGEAADRNMVIFLSAGAVTAAAGGLIYYLGRRDRARAERDFEIFAAPTRDGGFLGLSATY